DAKDKLRNYREDQSRKSEEVVELWKEFLSASKHKLGNEEWVLVEQVCIAACDCGDLKVAHECYQILKQQFSGSLRVAYLHGLILEADGCFEKAEELYTDLLKQDETNSLARKRKIALLRAQNKIAESIKELAEYLQRYMSDFEAWLEMCDLYLLEMDYAKAAFCMEELLLANPYNHLLHQKYAEIKYTQGGTDNMEISKKYFAQSLKLNPNNMKSLFGFYMASTHLCQKNVAIKSKKDKNFEYASFAWKNIVKKYQVYLSFKQNIFH
ncbi:hypothetical protein HELRODRAFT_73211, partial [Helobdella robusta]|uniref:ER membrane protein complex subunit 2 n=1 Tax=Helobdella robusta TaxID=6412 RepID=T1G1B8_HELRO